MLSHLSAVVLLLAAIAGAQDISVITVKDTLTQAGIIPDVFPSDFTPTFPLEVIFHDPANNAFTPVTAGGNLTIPQTTYEPYFAVLSDDVSLLEKQYLIAMIDPDAPIPPNRTLAQYLHFLGGNFAGQNFSDSSNILFFIGNQTDAAVPYMAPGPPETSIPHRYVLAIYEQNSTDISIDPSTYPADRLRFNLTDFATQRGDLILVGATFFYLGPDSVNGPSSNASSTF